MSVLLPIMSCVPNSQLSLNLLNEWMEGGWLSEIGLWQKRTNSHLKGSESMTRGPSSKKSNYFLNDSCKNYTLHQNISLFTLLYKMRFSFTYQRVQFVCSFWFFPGALPHVSGGIHSLVQSLGLNDFLIPTLHPIAFILHPTSAALPFHPHPALASM